VSGKAAGGGAAAAAAATLPFTGVNLLLVASVACGVIVLGFVLYQLGSRSRKP
jgi:hypothetical protein